MSILDQLSRAIQVSGNHTILENVPHPEDIKDVRKTEWTKWHPSVLKSDKVTTSELERITYVRGMIVELTSFDIYQEPIGEPRFVMLHKYEDPERANQKDISSTPLKPDRMRELVARFPGACQEFSINLARQGRELPLCMLDAVPPEVMNEILGMGVREIREFADFDDVKMQELVDRLLDKKMDARAQFVHRYRAAAQEMAGPGQTPSPKRQKQAA